MKFKTRLPLFVVTGLFVVVAMGCTGARAGAQGSAFAKTNLYVWAFEEYDAVSRTADERAALLRSLGITKAGYIGRNVERMSEFDAYVAAYREHDVELIAVWTPLHTEDPLGEAHIRMFLDAVDRHQLRIQWWVTLEEFDRFPEAERVNIALGLLRNLLPEARRRGLQLSIYGHGRDDWFTQPENQLAIVERLVSSNGEPEVGIAYNFHWSHSHVDRFESVFPKLLPYLEAVGLNGIEVSGPMIIPIGEGESEQGMIEVMHRAGYRGPVGILDHTRALDSAVVLQRNIEGLRNILTAIGDTEGAATY